MGNIQTNDKQPKTGKSPAKGKHFIRNLNRKSSGRESRKHGKKKGDTKRDVIDRESDKIPDSDNNEAIEASDNDTVECLFQTLRRDGEGTESGSVQSDVTVSRCGLRAEPRSATRDRPNASAATATPAVSPANDSTSESVFTDPLTPLAVELNQCYYSAESDSAHDEPLRTLTPSLVDVPEQITRSPASSTIDMPHDEATSSLSTVGMPKEEKNDVFSDNVDRNDAKVMGAFFIRPRAEHLERTTHECNHDFRDNRLKPCPGQSSFTISKHRKVELSPVVCDPTLTILDNEKDRRHSSVSDAPMTESNVLRKVASLTLDKLTETKVVRSKFVPEKLDFQLHEKFEGQMLLNWFVSSIAENNNLKGVLNTQDLKSLGIQNFTQLLAAGVLRQISDKNAPTESTFKPNLMYYWAHMEAPAPQPVTPGRLHMTAWPPDKDLHSTPGNITNYSSLENNKLLNQNNNDEINDISEAKTVISQLRRKLLELQYQLEKLKISAQIETLNKNLEKGFDTEHQLLDKRKIELVCKEVQTCNASDINKFSVKPVINIPDYDPHIRTNVNIDNNLDLSSLEKSIEIMPENRSEKIENYCKLNKSRELNNSFRKDDVIQNNENIDNNNMSDENVIPAAKDSDQTNIISSTHDSSSDASFLSTCPSNELFNSQSEILSDINHDNLANTINVPIDVLCTNIDTNKLGHGDGSLSKSNKDPLEHCEITIKEAKPCSPNKSKETSDSTNKTSTNSKILKLLDSGQKPRINQSPSDLPPPSPGMAPSPPPTPGTCPTSDKVPILIEQPSVKPIMGSEYSSSTPPLIPDLESSLTSKPVMEPPTLPKHGMKPPTPEISSMESPSSLPSMVHPPPPMPGIGPLSAPMPGMEPQLLSSLVKEPPLTPMSGTDLPPSQVAGMGPPPPPMPSMGPPPPPMPVMGPPPPPMPGMGPPPPPMPGMGPPPPPMPGMGPPPPPMPGIGPPPPPMPGLSPLPPPMPGSGPPPPPSMPGLGPPSPGLPPPLPNLGPVPFPAPPVGGWNMQRATLRKIPVKPAAPMKPLYWTRILATSAPTAYQEDSSGLKPLWLEIEETKLDNIDEFTDLFSRQVVKAPIKKKVEVKTKIMPIKILDSKRSQNVGILAQSLHVEFSEIENAIYNFDTSVVSLEALQQIYELRASDEELSLIKEHLHSKPDIPLDKPEGFLHDLSGIPNFAERISCFMFQAEFEDSISTTMHKLDNLKHTCEFLMTSESLKKLFAIILTLGNYMNGGNGQRGQADGFGLEILSKLKDVKSKQSNTTLLHFIVRTYMGVRGTRSAGEVPAVGEYTLPVPEPGDVARAAALDFADVAANLGTLAQQLAACKEKMKKVIEADALPQMSDESSKRLEVFKEKMTSFINSAEEKLKAENENLEDCRNKFIATVKFYQYTPKCGKLEECEPKEFFSMWTSFCSDLKDIYKKEEQIAIKEKLKEAKKLQEERKSLTQPKKEGGLKARLQRLSTTKK
ncbi:uncharacterized protein LOC131841957 [Achroia grisella]|uniref:uncharacterized protein LOC131841957 n=1 Tax=Achroia grisella TaxID=688607 RepID=UPI0027D2B114|nr:uncharacterized protein LOC131841957 [Achroia grisella]